MKLMKIIDGFVNSIKGLYIKNKKLFIFKTMKQNIWEKSDNINEEIVVIHNTDSETISDTTDKTANTQENIDE